MLRVIDWKKGKTRKGSLNETEGDESDRRIQDGGHEYRYFIDNANECGAGNNVVRPRFGFDSKQTFWL